MDDDDQESSTSTAVMWKPWAPEIGQRLRIRLSAECPLLRAAPELEPIADAGDAPSGITTDDWSARS